MASLAPRCFIFIFIFIFISASVISSAHQPNNDTDTLSRFRSLADPHGNLLANWTTNNACTSTWQGVKCTHGRVTSLALPSLALRGSIDVLAELNQLRLLDLHSNRLNGTILPITHCFNLKLVYLSANDFSGQIPSQIAHLNRLLRLDLSDNNLEGPIPNRIFKLPKLLTLRLQNNLLTGQLPHLSSSDLLPLEEFNVSNNELSGNLSPQLRAKFGDTSFLGNTGLCGSTPFHPVCSPTNKSSPTAAMAMAQTVPSNPAATTEDSGRETKGLGTAAIVAIVVGNAVLLLVLSSFFVAYYCGKHSGENNLSSRSGNKAENTGRSSYSSEKKQVYTTSGGGGDSDGTTASDRSRLVFFEKRKQFILEDLLRASAEMLGKGNLGTVYKAVLEDGCVVAVKRLKDANPCPKKEFEQYMDVIGRLTHPNIVRLKAYYYAKEEKLLVFDYLPNGSLHSLLHGNRGPGRIPLDWTTRISLVLGAARGLARIHEEYSVSKIPHGNVKSSNVLLDKNGVACISDFGLALLLNPFHATARLGGYRAPEQADTKKLSQKADVYSFGVLILEMLTGKAPALYPSSPAQCERGVDLPKWVRSVVRDEWTAQVFDPELLRYKDIEEELVEMLQVGLACASHRVEERPSMPEVAKMIEHIRVEQSPLGEDLDESRSSLSPSLATTEDALGNHC